MEVLDEIIEWASSLPYWQQVAVVSVLNGTCGDDEIESIAAICIREQGDTEPLANELGDPLKNFKYETSEDEPDGVVITEIHSTQNINAIRDDSKLTFGETGLTIVYGSNAVGKSGYSRIFKAACMCRDNERIHGDIGREDIVEPSAVIAYKNGENNHEHVWNNSADINAALNTVHIFDTRTARIQLNEKSDVKYVPSGLDIFDKLADVFSEVRDKVQEEVDHCHHNSPQFDLIFSDYEETSAYKYITDLSDKSNVEKLKQITGLKPDEEKELDELRKEIRNKEANHPSKRQELLKLKRGRFAKLHNQINEYQRKLQQKDFDEVHQLKTSMLQASKIAETAKNKKFDEKGLPGTGGALWKILWEAAESFSDQHAYHEHKFPFTGDDSICVLCQQPLDDPAKIRLKDYNSFVLDKSQELLKKSKQTYEAKLEDMKNIEVFADQETLDAAFEELKSDEYGDVEALKTLFSACKTEFKSALTSAQDEKTEKPHKIAIIDFSPRDRFKTVIKQMDEEAKNFDITKFTQKLNQQKRRVSELESQLLLKKHEEQINKEVANLKRLAMLKKCLAQTDTTTLSRKGGALANKYLGDNLRDTYDEQLKELNRKGLIVELRKSHVDHGTTYSEIVITTEGGGGDGRYKPDEIMSESEQKVASLAGFFTELSIAPHKSSIILDDPVTSLDELNTARIAKRIVKEAAERQVIVFTHNLFFTSELLNYADASEVPLTARTVSKAAYTGQVHDDLPWQALSTSKRIKKLRAKQQELGALFRKNQTVEYAAGVKSFYGSLRETWERGVEEILFQGVVKRYNRAIETKKLSRVQITDADKQAVEENMTQCSFYASHDAPDNVDSVEVPEPDQLSEDLDKISTWVADIEKRSQK